MLNLKNLSFESLKNTLEIFIDDVYASFFTSAGKTKHLFHETVKGFVTAPVINRKYQVDTTNGNVVAELPTKTNQGKYTNEINIGDSIIFFDYYDSWSKNPFVINDTESGKKYTFNLSDEIKAIYTSNGWEVLNSKQTCDKIVSTESNGISERLYDSTVKSSIRLMITITKENKVYSGYVMVASSSNEQHYTEFASIMNSDLVPHIEVHRILNDIYIDIGLEETAKIELRISKD